MAGFAPVGDARGRDPAFVAASGAQQEMLAVRDEAGGLWWVQSDRREDGAQGNPGRHVSQLQCTIGRYGVEIGGTRLRIEAVGAEKPGRANNILYSLRSMCSWAQGPVGLLGHNPVHGVKTFQSNAGHKPWTPAQLEFAEKNFTGMLRRAFFLARYAGQRASDIVRLDWTDVDGDTITLRQKKTGVQPICPIFPELQAEMATWEKKPGPFLLQETGRNAGRPVTTNQLWKVFNAARGEKLSGVVWHSLRANAVIRLRRASYTGQQISDMVGMSVEMIERYSRYSDRKAGAEAVVREYPERKL